MHEMKLRRDPCLGTRPKRENTQQASACFTGVFQLAPFILLLQLHNLYLFALHRAPQHDTRKTHFCITDLKKNVFIQGRWSVLIAPCA